MTLIRLLLIVAACVFAAIATWTDINFYSHTLAWLSAAILATSLAKIPWGGRAVTSPPPQ